MATGYTCKIQDGTITEFKDFAFLCMRAFGACVGQRDEDGNNPPRLIELDISYQKENIKRCLKDIKNVKKQTDEEFLAEKMESLERDLKNAKEQLEKSKITREKYEKILKAALEWEAPTKEHEEFKKFLISQLEGSIDVDCDSPDSYYPNSIKNIENEIKFLTIKNVKALKKEKIASLEENIKYYEDSIEKEKKNIKKANNWMKAIFDSFESKKG